MMKWGVCWDCGAEAKLSLYDLGEKGYAWLCYDCAKKSGGERL